MSNASQGPKPDLEMKGKSVVDQALPPIRRFHGFAPRSEILQPLGKSSFGKFGRMFPDLQPLEPPEEKLKALAQTMEETDLGPAGDNPGIPAGYTYLGQFIDHDITLDTTAIQEVRVDPLATRNFRTPMLDLDCLYGLGPVAQPYLYQRADAQDGERNHFFQLGATAKGRGDPNIPEGKPNDLPRAANKFALIGDPRNDENLVVQQTHVAMLKFHNKIVEGLRNKSIVSDSPLRKSNFEEARDLVIWHYQWIVLHDFLRRIADPTIVDDVLNNGRKFYRFDTLADPFIPVEFSAGAYRLGHSMVREAYNYNRVFSIPSKPNLPSGTLGLLFTFTGLSGTTVPTPSDWIIDWRRFFDIPSSNGVTPGLSRKINTLIAPTLTKVPSVPEPFSLAERNLIRGLRLRLPPGQSVARAMGFEPLSPEDVGKAAQDNNLHVETPLWYYILKEAEVQTRGLHLGQVGSRIVAEVFIGLLQADSSSFLVRRPQWKPTLPRKDNATFTMGDLLEFVGDINPIGD